LKVGRILVKVNRISAWLLLILMIIFIVSGYAWWNRVLLSLQLARYLHTELDLLLVFFFLVHVLISARFTLARWKVGNRRLVDILLLATGLSFFWLVLSIR
jgi:hypothetical protein